MVNLTEAIQTNEYFKHTALMKINRQHATHPNIARHQDMAMIPKPTTCEQIGIQQIQMLLYYD